MRPAPVALLCALLAGTASAESLREGFTDVIRAAPGNFVGAKVGEWVTYKLNRAGGAGEGYWRLAVVGEQKDNKNRDAVWVELDLGAHWAMKAPLGQMRMLVARSEGMTGSGVTRMVTAEGFERPRELDATAIARMFTPPAREPGAARAEPVPTDRARVITSPSEKLMTFAGTLTAVRHEVRYRNFLVKRIWVSEQVPLLRLAKMEVPAAGISMELREYGLDAKPQMAAPDPSVPLLTAETLQKMSDFANEPDEPQELEGPLLPFDAGVREKNNQERSP